MFRNRVPANTWTMSAALSKLPSLTTSWNVHVSSGNAAAGITKPGVALAAFCSVTGDPARWVQW
jgi:hypothetical protein